jgi:hypothetical protein
MVELYNPKLEGGILEETFMEDMFFMHINIHLL